MGRGDGYFTRGMILTILIPNVDAIPPHPPSTRPLGVCVWVCGCVGVNMCVCMYVCIILHCLCMCLCVCQCGSHLALHCHVSRCYTFDAFTSKAKGNTTQSVCLERMAKTFNRTSVVDKNHDLILYQMTKGREGLELNAIRLSLLLQEQQQKPS